MMKVFLLGSFLVLLLLLYWQYRWIEQSSTQKKAICVLLCSIVLLMFLLFRFAYPFAHVEQEGIRFIVLLLSTLAILWFALLSMAGVIVYFVKQKTRMQCHVNAIICIVLTLSIVLCVWGRIQAITMKDTQYHVTFTKPLKEEVHIAFITDLHIGSGFDRASITKLFDELSHRNIDALLIGGDLFDEATPLSSMEYFCTQSERLKLRDGIFYVSGNHEQLQQRPSVYEQLLEKSGITILRDEAVLLNDAYYLAGRLDKVQKRASLETIIAHIDSTKPLIVLDHRPDYDENGKNRIDLQLSGHTHHGQIFPNTLLTKIAYPHDYGYYDAPYPMIVSSGAGTWGFPIRLASDSEIVYIQISGQQS